METWNDGFVSRLLTANSHVTEKPVSSPVPDHQRGSLSVRMLYWKQYTFRMRSEMETSRRGALERGERIIQTAQTQRKNLRRWGSKIVCWVTSLEVITQAHYLVHLWRAIKQVTVLQWCRRCGLFLTLSSSTRGRSLSLPWEAVLAQSSSVGGREGGRRWCQFCIYAEPHWEAHFWS